MRRLLAVAVVWRLFGRFPRPRFGGAQDHPWPIPGRTIFVGRQEFVVRQVGPEGASDVVLIHGLGGSALAEWYEVGPLLAERHRVTVIDHRNHGLGPKAVARYEIADLADDVAGAMTQVGIHDATVVGYSMGGAIAQEVAHRHPGRVRRLVLIATFATHPPAWRVARQIGTLLLRAWERVTGIGTPEVRAGYLIGVGAVALRHAEWMWDETHRRDVEGGAAASFALLRFDSSGWVGELTQPTLVVIPTRDQLVPSRWQYELAGMIPGAEIVDVAGGRHEIPWTHAERVAGEIDAFLER